MRIRCFNDYNSKLGLCDGIKWTITYYAKQTARYITLVVT